MKLKEEKKKNSSEVTVKFNIDSEEMSGYMNEVYKQKAKDMKLPGFRKGKAPLNVVQQRLGDSILPDAINYAIDDAIKEKWDEFKFSPVTEPSCTIDDYKPEKGLEFTISYDTKPEIKIGKYKKAMVNVTGVAIADADIENEIKRVQESKVEFEKIEDEGIKVGAGQKLMLETASSEEQEKLAGEEMRELSFFTRDEGEVKGQDDNALRKKIENELWEKGLGEEIEFEFSYGDDEPAPELKGKTYYFRIRLKEVHAKKVPEITDEFAKENAQHDTVAAWKEDIKNRLQEHGDSLVRRTALDEILDKIAEGSTYTLSQGLIDKDVQGRARDLGMRFGLGQKSLEEMAQLLGKTEDSFKKELEEVAVRQLKHHLILVDIAEKEEMDVTDGDLDAEFAKIAESTGQDVAQIREMYAKEDREWEVKAEVRNRRVLDFLFEKNTKQKGKDIAYAELVAKENPQG